MKNQPSRQKKPEDKGPPLEVLFDPSKSDTELFDTLAEQQAKQLKVNSSQLRRFFGEIKDLYRRFTLLSGTKSDAEKDEIYRTQIEPRFKMIRSKVAYATRAGGQTKLPERFATFLKECITRVQNRTDFERFVMHLEAVVGFMYGEGRVER